MTNQGGVSPNGEESAQTGDDARTPEEPNPSFKPQESKSPYNEAKARRHFEALMDRLKEEQTAFRGDWWQLAKLVRNLEEDEENPDIKPEERLKDWNQWRDQVQLRGPLEPVHLEGALLQGRRLEHAKLEGARLDGARLH